MSIKLPCHIKDAFAFVQFLPERRGSGRLIEIQMTSLAVSEYFNHRNCYFVTTLHWREDNSHSQVVDRSTQAIL